MEEKGKWRKRGETKGKGEVKRGKIGKEEGIKGQSKNGEKLGKIQEKMRKSGKRVADKKIRTNQGINKFLPSM